MTLATIVTFCFVGSEIRFPREGRRRAGPLGEYGGKRAKPSLSPIHRPIARDARYVCRPPLGDIESSTIRNDPQEGARHDADDRALRLRPALLRPRHSVGRVKGLRQRSPQGGGAKLAFALSSLDLFRRPELTQKHAQSTGNHIERKLEKKK